jgi:hypothetical protein
MTGYADRMMVALSDRAALVELVAPHSDTNGTRIRTLLALGYDFPFAAVRAVTKVTSLSFRCQQALFPPVTTSGTWTTTNPEYARTDISHDTSGTVQPQWLDIVAEFAVDVVLEADGGGVDSIRIDDIGDFVTLEQFRQKFRYFDLDAFMAEHDLTTVDDLKNAFQYLRAQIRLTQPPPFDPGDPANSRRFPLRVAMLLREVIDIAGVLRDVRLAIRAADRSTATRPTVHEGQPKGAVVPVVAFPDAALAATGLSAPELTAFFAAQDIVALLHTP